MSAEDRVKELEGELQRERLARRIVDAALRDLMEERDKLIAELSAAQK